ncbi:hypothetical protein MUK42_00736 [Musa troglodytarum]|uniref:DUF7731 domain-containing protein n=1 Tax=Musa troglodytarum TaxID=320322 RepID=A0A9E7FCR5_9LILI|nr:hypothetical protein MUK42_00736 [Musa troglodytarum]
MDARLQICCGSYEYKLLSLKTYLKLLPAVKDAIQIVARAALCFDNRTVIDNCLTSMGISTNATANAASNSSTTVPQQDNATASFCSSPCLGEMMLMTSCIDGIMSSFTFYKPGLMQGVQAIFQMACSGGGGNGSATPLRCDGRGNQWRCAGCASSHVSSHACPLHLL